jgi:hypothetical protein
VIELELARDRDDRRCYRLGEVGSLRLEGWGARRATVECGGRTWAFSQGGFWRRTVTAFDAAGTQVGEFRARGMRRGGSLRWGSRELVVRPSSAWRERYALAEGDRDLAVLDAKAWGRRPVGVSLDDLDAVGAVLLLFACFVVRTLAADASATAAASAPSA